MQKFGVHKIEKKIKILKICIRSAQNVGKVWISRKKSSWSHLGPSQAIFSMDQKNVKMYKICLFSLVGKWALFNRLGVMCWCHKHDISRIVAARALATYFIPGCVGRGVRLGSEGSSVGGGGGVGGGGVRKSGNLS